MYDDIDFKVNAFLFIGYHTLVIQGWYGDEEAADKAKTWFAARYTVAPMGVNTIINDVRELLIDGNTELTESHGDLNFVDSTRSFCAMVAEEAALETEAFKNL